MKSLQQFLFQPKQTKANSERALITSEFVERINRERKGTKWKPVTPRAVAIKTAHLSLQDMYYFLSVCKQSRSGFSKCFFGLLKVNK